MSNGNGFKASSLAEQVKAITKDLDRHQTGLDDLYKKAENAGKANWQVLLSAIGVLILVIGGLWALSVSPINSDLGKLGQWQLRSTDRLIALERSDTGQQEKLAAMEKRIDILRELIRSGEMDKLSKGEYARDQTAVTKDSLALNKRLDDMNLKLDSVFPTQKIFEDLLKRLGTLEQQQRAKP